MSEKRMYSLKQVGKFRIEKGLWTDYEFSFPIRAEITPIQVEYFFHNEIFEIEAIGGCFREVNPLEMVPWYSFSMKEIEVGGRVHCRFGAFHESEFGNTVERIRGTEDDLVLPTPHISSLLALMDHQIGALNHRLRRNVNYGEETRVTLSAAWPALVRIMSKVDFSEEDRKFIWTNTHKLTSYPTTLTNIEAMDILRDLMNLCVKRAKDANPASEG
jgi:hypothetical protein